MRKRITNGGLAWGLAGILSLCATASVPRAVGPYLLPMNCKELLPDPGQFLGFLEAVAGGNARSDKAFSKRLFRILALRDKLSDHPDAVRGQNPIDQIIYRALCFYREQKEPLKAVPYDDPAFVSFLKSGFNDLEKKVDQAVLQWELEGRQRAEFEKQFKLNQRTIEALRMEADKEADRVLEKMKIQAMKKRKNP